MLMCDIFYTTDLFLSVIILLISLNMVSLNLIDFSIVTEYHLKREFFPVI